MRRYVILSDIHGNLYALQAVMDEIRGREFCGVILLGDLIDYGMESNEVVAFIRDQMPYSLVCSLWGNHEHAVMTEDFTRFSSQRGVESARFTQRILSDDTKRFLETGCSVKGMETFELEGRNCLAVHGSLEDCFWKGILPDNVRGDYERFDLVFSGHTHYSHFFHKFYDSMDASMRNQRAVYFLNPGSVGQPRNHNPLAQYAVFDFDTMSAELRAVRYDIKAAQSLYKGEVSEFYRDRLQKGI